VNLSVSLLVNQRTLFRKAGTGTVLVMQVFSLPLSFSQKNFEQQQGNAYHPAGKVLGDSYAHINLK
jgi:hypothetical protein